MLKLFLNNLFFFFKERFSSSHRCFLLLKKNGKIYFFFYYDNWTICEDNFKNFIFYSLASEYRLMI